MNLNSIFVSNLKHYRLQKKLSQEKLAERSKVHRTYISLIEREKRNITIKNIEKLAKGLDVEPYKLLKERK